MNFLDKSSRESRKAFIGTFVFHIFLLLIALLYFLPEQAKSVVAIVELGWGNTGNVGLPSSQKPKKNASAIPQKKKSQLQKTKLPKIKLPIADSKKKDKPRVIQQSSVKTSSASTLRKIDNIRSSSALSSIEKNGNADESSEGKENASGNGSNDGLKDGEGSVGYSISWKGGGTRKLLEGNLPQYPAGVNERAQIRIQTTVLPDGSVEKCIPVRTAHRLLVEAALREIRLWRFDPLDASYPQTKQKCIVTMNFILE